MDYLNWVKFIGATKDRKPVGFLIEVVEKLNSRKGLALDLGCGAGVDSKYLAQNGFSVEAIDMNKESIDQTKKTCKGLKVAVINKNITDYKFFNNAYQIIISWNTLPFLRKEEAKNILINIQKGLNEGGYFIFSLFGLEDDWAKTKPKMSFWTIEELKNILSEMEFIKIIEEKQIGPIATGGTKF